MEIDFSKCRIRTPAMDERLPLYRMLMELFEIDRPVYETMIEKHKRFYTWTPYTLYLGDEILGNAALVPMRIWLGGRPADIVGVGAVATATHYQRKGVARHLIRHCAEILDRQQMPSALFTDLSVVYEDAGFRTIPQVYRAAGARRMDFDSRGFDCEILDTVDEGHVEQMKGIYTNEYPNYDGKVVKDRAYWQLYELLFNPYPSPRLLFCTGDGRLLGYARVDVEDDRLLLSELCGRPSAVDVTEALRSFVRSYAVELGLDLITFALPPGHFSEQILHSHQIHLEPEPPGAHREIFMVRPAAGQALGPLERLQWSLADKF